MPALLMVEAPSMATSRNPVAATKNGARRPKKPAMMPPKAAWPWNLTEVVWFARCGWDHFPVGSSGIDSEVSI